MFSDSNQCLNILRTEVLRQSVIAYAVMPASILLCPASGSIGTNVTVNGFGFLPSTSVDFVLGSTDVTPSIVPSTDGTGKFNATIKVPTSSDLVPGSYILEVTDGTNTATAIFTITVSVPSNIPWQLIAVSPDMMNQNFCSTTLPPEWKSSIAISAYEPDPSTYNSCLGTITYFKISCTVTGFLPEAPQSEKWMQNQIEYQGCYGALINISVYPDSDTPDIANYPHIVDFEPKTRDLYQDSTDNNEVLSVSKSELKTDKTLAFSWSTETGVTSGHTIDESLGTSGVKFGGTFSGQRTDKWGDKNTDTYSRQSDSLAEDQLKTGTSTKTEQQYNLLKGYHVGTNRAVFLMLPYPHTLQPTDYRSFVNGLRMIEGVQDFILVVSRPKGTKGLNIDVHLDTAHFPEDTPISYPEPSYDESTESFLVYIDNSNTNQDLEKFGSAKYTISDGWIIDRRPIVGVSPREDKLEFDGGHPGIIDNYTKDSGTPIPSNYNYQAVSDTTVQIYGILPFGLKEPFNHTYKVLTRSTDPRPSNAQPSTPTYWATILEFSLCASFNSGNCLTPVEVPQTLATPPNGKLSIVDEPVIHMHLSALRKDVLGKSRYPAMMELIKNIGHALKTSPKSSSRIPYGAVGPLDSDHYKKDVMKIMPAELLRSTLGRVLDPSDPLLSVLGRNMTVEEALAMDLPTFARRIGENIKNAANARARLLSLK